MKLSSTQTDRALGVMLGLASGDALGAGYEFGPPFEGPVTMKGGGGFRWAPGEWTDDTSMAIPLLRAAAEGKDLLAASTLDEIVAAWVAWATTAPDVGSQTRAILSGLEPSAAAATAASRSLHERTGRTAGNGSLMRTAPVALAYLHDPEALATAARTISSLTHYDEDAGDACVLWCLAIRHSILANELDLRVGLDALAPDRRELWNTLITEAEQKQPRDFEHNGWVVEALQGAWSAITHGTILVDTLERAVRGGRDTDTVAAIAGSLAGAHYGASAIPLHWQRIVHGWPGLRALDLLVLSAPSITGSPVPKLIDYDGYGDISTLVQHPHDPGVWLGAVGALDHLPAAVDAVVTLCRIGTEQVPASITEHVVVRLIDSANENKNPNLVFTLTDAADTVATLRAEGHTVFLHCVQAVSRTPTVAALYSQRHLNVPIAQALEEVSAVLPAARPNKRFAQILRNFAAEERATPPAS